MLSLIDDRPQGGFCFNNCERNKFLQQKGFKPPNFLKTGTTICGAIFDGGVVVAADKRATEGSIVAEKASQKVHYISDNMFCCGAGTAADITMTCRLISSQIELHRLNSNRVPRIITALRLLKQYLFKYQGYVSAALVLGGVDSTGPHLYGVAPHGSTDKVPYIAMGSGTMSAMSVLESNFKFGMTKEEAMQLCRDAIVSGIFNDLASGSNVDLVVITPAGKEVYEPFEIVNEKGIRAAKYLPKPGSTAILKRYVQKVEYDVVTTRVIRDLPSSETELMDTA